MGFPSDIVLPNSARYYTFLETKKRYNSNYDIVWSFQYKLPRLTSNYEDNILSGANIPDKYELGFSTFLTTLSSPVSSLPGQYIGDQDPASLLSGGQITSESDISIITEDGIFVVTDENVLSGGLLKIAFDSTGFYALSGRDGRTGTGLTNVKKQSLVLRDYNSNVIYNESLSSISTSFSTLSTDTFRTIRFRYVNLGQKLFIDYHESDTTDYTTLTTIDLGFRLGNYSNLNDIFCGFAFTTPISSSSADLSAKEFYLSNFHIEGYEGATVLTETITSAEIPVNPAGAVSTISNITARSV